jgi:hypothetical protein
MNPRLFIPVLLLFVCSSLLAQPEIVSITYEPDYAVLTRNEPPPGIIYYWQGASCGILMNHSGSTTFASSDGTYYLREYNSSSSTWAIACASTIVMIPDVIPPILSDVTTGPVAAGNDISATSNEDGLIFLVPDGTAANIGAITAAQVAQGTSVAGVATALSTDALPEGGYVVYAADGADNISAASPVIDVIWATYIDLNTANPNQVQLYPGNVEDILYIKSNVRVNSVQVYSVQGSQVINITTPTDQVDMSGLSAGVYIVRLQLEDNEIFSGKISKQ